MKEKGWGEFLTWRLKLELRLTLGELSAFLGVLGGAGRRGLGDSGLSGRTAITLRSDPDLECKKTTRLNCIVCFGIKHQKRNRLVRFYLWCRFINDFRLAVGLSFSARSFCRPESPSDSPTWLCSFSDWLLRRDATLSLLDCRSGLFEVELKFEVLSRESERYFGGFCVAVGEISSLSEAWEPP